MNDDNKTDLLKIFSAIAIKSDSTITLDTRIEGLQLDSLDVLDVLMQIEEKFNIELPVATFSSFIDIRSILSELPSNKV